MNFTNFADILILAQASLINWTILLLVQPTHGAHIWDTSLTMLSRFAYWSNLIIVLYVPSILLAKWAILLQLSRIFAVQPRTGTWWIIRALIYITTTFYVVMWGFDIFQCVPREKIWNPSVPGHCYSVEGILIGTAIFNVVLNCTILALPLIILRNLKMKARKKVTVCAVFAVAGLASISSIMRTIYSFIFASNDDMTHTIFPVAMWAVAEISCIIFATAFPTLPLFVEYVKGGRQAARRKTGYASKTLAAMGDREQGGSAKHGSMRRDTDAMDDARWYSLGSGEAQAETETEVRAGTRPWDGLPLRPKPVAMGRLYGGGESIRTDSRGTVGQSLEGGIGVTKTFEVRVMDMV